MHRVRTFLTSLLDSGWWNEPATLVMVILRSDWFSTFKSILFRSPFTTSVLAAVGEDSQALGGETPTSECIVLRELGNS